MFFLSRKTIVDRDSGNLYSIYIYKKQIVVLASEPVGGRYRVTELPCYDIEHCVAHFGCKSVNICNATSDILCFRVTGPQVGTSVCSYYVVYMLLALHRPAFTTLCCMGSLVGGQLPLFLF